MQEQIDQLLSLMQWFRRMSTMPDLSEEMKHHYLNLLSRTAGILEDMMKEVY